MLLDLFSVEYSSTTADNHGGFYLPRKKLNKHELSLKAQEQQKLSERADLRRLIELAAYREPKINDDGPKVVIEVKQKEFKANYESQIKAIDLELLAIADQIRLLGIMDREEDDIQALLLLV